MLQGEDGAFDAPLRHKENRSNQAQSAPSSKDAERQGGMSPAFLKGVILQDNPNPAWASNKTENPMVVGGGCASYFRVPHPLYRVL